MWKSSREIDTIDNSLRRSSSNLNFVRSSLKDVENLFTDDNNISTFNKTLDQPSPCSATKRLSVFHRIHLANKLARAFSTKLITNSDKSPPEPEKSEKSNRPISIPGAEKRIVIYTTSLRVVRPTFEACRSVKSILRSFRVSIDERDLSMDSKFLEELNNIMAEGGGDVTEKMKLTLPRVFIGGEYIGGAEEVKRLHDNGELKKVVERTTGGELRRVWRL